MPDIPNKSHEGRYPSYTSQVYQGAILTTILKPTVTYAFKSTGLCCQLTGI